MVDANTVGAWACLVIAIIGWLGVGMEAVGREHAGTARRGRLHNGRCQSISCVPGVGTVDIDGVGLIA